MRKEEKNMKILMIKNDGKNNKGFYLNPKKVEDITRIDINTNPVEDITKEDILDMVDYIIENDVELDPYSKGILPNPVQDIIYENLYNQFVNIINNKDIIKKQIDDKFKEAESKYNKE